MINAKLQNVLLEQVSKLQTVSETIYGMLHLKNVKLTEDELSDLCRAKERVDEAIDALAF